MSADQHPLRLGIVGTARIAAMSVVAPARDLAGTVQLTAVASRSAERARAFATKHRVAASHDSYDALLGDRDVDAVYIALPNGLHRHWCERALEAGKHVLCEKPLAMNADEAASLGELARRYGRVLAEGMHFRHHPLAARIREIVASGELGRTEHIEARVSFPVLFRSNLRYDRALGGGATMDQGCYAVSLVRLAAGGEPQVRAAHARLASPEVDRHMAADLEFPDGATGKIVCSIWSGELFRCGLRIRGSNGELSILNPVAPHLFHWMRFNLYGREHHERVRHPRSTYWYQLKAFAESVRTGAEPIANAREAAATLRVIDDMYHSAGLHPRQSVAHEAVRAA